MLERCLYCDFLGLKVQHIAQFCCREQCSLLSAHVILLTLISLFFPVFTETYLHLHFIHTSISISATSLYMRGKPACYGNRQKEKAQDTESSRVDCARLTHLQGTREINEFTFQIANVFTGLSLCDPMDSPSLKQNFSSVHQ